jgi:putative SOS response-associated peptidase YedK
MCSRFRSIHAAENSARALQAHLRLNFPSGWNVAPTELAPILIGALDGPPQGILGRFGFTIYGRLMMNARSDKIAGLHKTSLRERRCVVPVLGYYEWRTEGDEKQPYFFERNDGQPMTLAGIWQEADHKGDTRPSFLIVTQEPNEFTRQYHNRVPFVLADDQVMPWLDLSHEVRPEPSMMLSHDRFSVRPMLKAMNRPTVKDLDLIDPEAERVQRQLAGVGT